MFFVCVSVTDGQLLGIGLGDIDPRKQLITSSDGRPKSCCEVPRVPGIKYVSNLHCNVIMNKGVLCFVPSVEFCCLSLL
jgi:hypothetical protein